MAFVNTVIGPGMCRSWGMRGLHQPLVDKTASVSLACR